MAIFGTTSIPGDSIEVRSGGVVAVGAAFATTVGLVGGMDTANGSATPGEVVEVASSANAASLFGEDSELKQQVDLVFQNGNISTIYAVGVSETSVSAEAAGGQSGTLDNVPVFDPNVQPEHEITAADTSGTDPTVNIVYDSPPQTPGDADTVNVNPVTGEFEFDAAADGSYEFDYDYGDYTGALPGIVDKVPRTLAVLTENTSVANDTLTEVNSAAADFNFIHVQVGAVEVEPSSYSDAFDDRRLSVVAPGRAYTDAANTNEVRVLGATAGKQSGLALGDSSTYESLGGFADIGRTTDERYNNSELGNLIDSQVYPLKQGDRIFVVKDMTTSTDPRFERVYASEIVDEATEISHAINQQFVGELNTEENRFALGESHVTSYQELQEDDLLDAFSVQVSEGADPDEVDVEIGLDVVDIMDTIDVTITVGDVILNGGAS
jgi:hypothetical protein